MTDHHAWDNRPADEITVSRDRMREILIKTDHRLVYLALDLMQKWEELTGDSCGWDPDAYFTPLEHQLHMIAEECGMDYNRDIAVEAYRRRKEGEI
jgi:hypothetical protein